MQGLQVKQRRHNVISTPLQRILRSQSQKTCLHCRFHVQLIKALFKLVFPKLQEGRCTEVKSMKLSLNPVWLSEPSQR